MSPDAGSPPTPSKPGWAKGVAPLSCRARMVSRWDSSMTSSMKSK
ncbi:hypothetical protein ACFQXA_31735 [Nocardiopsis composta]